MNLFNINLISYSDILTTFTDNMDIYLIMIIALALRYWGSYGSKQRCCKFFKFSIRIQSYFSKKIMILASLGVLVGSVFESGMMEVARKYFQSRNAFLL